MNLLKCYLKRKKLVQNLVSYLSAQAKWDTKKDLLCLSITRATAVNDIALQPVGILASRIKTPEVSCIELMQLCLNRIHRFNNRQPINKPKFVNSFAVYSRLRPKQFQQLAQSTLHWRAVYDVIFLRIQAGRSHCCPAALAGNTRFPSRAGASAAGTSHSPL